MFECVWAVEVDGNTAWGEEEIKKNKNLQRSDWTFLKRDIESQKESHWLESDTVEKKKLRDD